MNGDEASAPCLARNSSAASNDVWPLPALLAPFLELHPKIHVELVVTNRHVNLVEEGVDLAVRAGKLEDSTLIARKLATSHLGLFASTAYLKRRPTPKSLAQLAEHDVVIFRGRQGKVRLKLHGPRGEDEGEVRGKVSSDDLSTSRSLIAAGLGIGLLPIFMEKCGGHAAQLERVLPDYALRGGGVHLVMPSARYVPTRVRLLSDFLAETLSQDSCEGATAAHARARPAR